MAVHSDALGTGQALPDWLRHSGFEALKLTGVSDPQEALGGAAPGHRHRVCVPSPGTRRPQLQLPRWGRAEEQDPWPRPADHAALQSPSRPHLHARRCDRVSRGHRGRREQRPRLTRQRQGLAGHRALGPFVLQTDRRLLKTGAAPHSGTAHGCRPSLRPPAQASTVSPRSVEGSACSPVAGSSLEGNPPLRDGLGAWRDWPSTGASLAGRQVCRADPGTVQPLVWEPAAPTPTSPLLRGPRPLPSPRRLSTSQPPCGPRPHQLPRSRPRAPREAAQAPCTRLPGAGGRSGTRLP